MKNHNGGWIKMQDECLSVIDAYLKGLITKKECCDLILLKISLKD